MDDQLEIIRENAARQGDLQPLRDIFAQELGRYGLIGLAERVRCGTDNSHGGMAAINAMEKAVAAERERCAKILEMVTDPDDESELGELASLAFNSPSDRTPISVRMQAWASVLAKAMRDDG